MMRGVGFIDFRGTEVLGFEEKSCLSMVPAALEAGVDVCGEGGFEYLGSWDRWR